MMAAVRRVPVVVILGATGTGKSKLSIELGRHFQGEIISADSMQLYKGLDIITAKVTAQEQAQCPHHLLSVLSPLSMNNTVVDFKRMALPIVDKLLQENKMPIIVGGTNYYIEALLWDFLIDKKTVDLVQPSGTPSATTVGQRSAAAADVAATPLPCPPPANLTEPSTKHRDMDGLDESNQHQHLGDIGRANIPTDSNVGLADGATLSCSNDERNSQCTEEGGGMKESAVRPPQGTGILITRRSSAVVKAPQPGPEKQLSASEARRSKEGKYAVFDSVHLHELLQKIDPDTAKRLHPQNRRKIVRALQVFDSYGVPMSDILQAQHASGNTPGLSGALRYPDCCVFWIQCEQEVLNQRLDNRVEDMLKNGLLSELHDLHSQYLDSIAAQNGQPDYTLGIFQSIGFKEFHDYLLLPPERRESPEGKALFDKGVEDLKLATRQYARRQLKWVKNRFLKRPGEAVPSVYSLDSTDSSAWQETVLQPAVSVLSALREGREAPVPPMKPESVPGTVYVHNVCQVCGDRVFTTLAEWQAHLGGRKHRKAERSKRRREITAEASQQMTEAKQSKQS